MSLRAGLITFAGAFMFSQAAAAQTASPIHQGGWIIAGSASLGRAHDDLLDADRTHFAVQPTALTFVTSRFALGGTMGFSYIDQPGGHASTLGIGPSARYYFASDPASWLPFVSASLMRSWGKERFTTTGNGTTSTIDADINATNVDASAGLTRLLVTHVGLTGEAYYTHSSVDDGLTNSSTRRSYDYGVRFGLTVFVR